MVRPSQPSAAAAPVRPPGFDRASKPTSSVETDAAAVVDSAADDAVKIPQVERFLFSSQ